MMGKCQLQVEAYTKNENDIYDQGVYELDEDGVIETIDWMATMSVDDEVDHFYFSVICDGGTYGERWYPKFKRAKKLSR